MCRRLSALGLSLAHLTLIWTQVAQHGEGRLVSSGCSGSHCETAGRGEANDIGLMREIASEELSFGRGLLGAVGRGRPCFGASCRTKLRSRGSDLVANRKRREFQAAQGRRDDSSYTCYGRGDSNVTLVTLVHGLPEAMLHNITINHLGWTQAWGYRYCQFRGILDWSRPPAWSKVVAVANVLACTESEWVMWIDIDAIFANASISLEGVLAAIEQGENDASHITHKDAVFSRDLRSFDVPLNTGVFLLRNTLYAANLLERIYNNVTLEVVHHPWWENKVFNDFFTEEHDEFKEHCLAVSPRWFNQHRPLLQKGDFVAHYAGMRNRYSLILSDLARKGWGFEASTSFDGASSLNSTRCGPFERRTEAPVETNQSAVTDGRRDELPSRLAVPPRQHCHEASCRPFRGGVTLEYMGTIDNIFWGLSRANKRYSNRTIKNKS